MHFYTIVLVKHPNTANSAQIRKKVEKLLEPYDEVAHPRKGQWDWWRVGGRWDGVIMGEKAKSEDKGFNFSTAHETIEDNCVTVPDLLKQGEKLYFPANFIEPNGKWHGSGWLETDAEREAWKKEVLDTFKKYTDCLAVGCDLHD